MYLDLTIIREVYLGGISVIRFIDDTQGNATRDQPSIDTQTEPLNERGE